jgi:hypothetical protein
MPSMGVGRITHGPHKAWVLRLRRWVKLRALWAPDLTTTMLLAGFNPWTLKSMPGLRPLQSRSNLNRHNVYPNKEDSPFMQNWLFCHSILLLEKFNGNLRYLTFENLTYSDLLCYVTFTFWNCYVLKLLRLETITCSDATLSDVSFVWFYVLSQ